MSYTLLPCCKLSSPNTERDSECSVVVCVETVKCTENNNDFFFKIVRRLILAIHADEFLPSIRLNKKKKIIKKASGQQTL